MIDPREISSEPALSVAEIAPVYAVASALARQDGRGLARRQLLDLAGRGYALSVLKPEAAGDPVVALIHTGLAGAADVFAALTPREREVAALVAQGHGNKRIAVLLGISVATVKDHVHRILAKTGLHTRAAVAAAWQRR